ncbi:T3SS effector NleB [Escherichia coli]|nr:T3SS effector NleB [Escherichia coli]
MKSKVDAHPYYDGLGKGIKRHFNYSSLHDYNAFVILLNLSMKYYTEYQYVYQQFMVSLPVVVEKYRSLGIDSDD